MLEGARKGLVHAAAHVTGGGIPENLPRVLPEGMGATIDSGIWPISPIFGLIERKAGASREDMFATFNMGIGMVLVTSADDVEEMIASASENEIQAMQIGTVTKGRGVELR